MFYVSNAVIHKDGTTAQNIFAYKESKEALSVYHSTLASNYVATNLKHFFVVISDDCGNIVQNEAWNEDVVEME